MTVSGLEMSLLVVQSVKKIFYGVVGGKKNCSFNRKKKNRCDRKWDRKRIKTVKGSSYVRRWGVELYC